MKAETISLAVIISSAHLEWDGHTLFALHWIWLLTSSGKWKQWMKYRKKENIRMIVSAGVVRKLNIEIGDAAFDQIYNQIKWIHSIWSRHASRDHKLQFSVLSMKIIIQLARPNTLMYSMFRIYASHSQKCSPYSIVNRVGAHTAHSKQDQKIVSNFRFGEERKIESNRRTQFSMQSKKN